MCEIRGASRQCAACTRRLLRTAEDRYIRTHDAEAREAWSLAEARHAATAEGRRELEDLLAGEIGPSLRRLDLKRALWRGEVIREHVERMAARAYHSDDPTSATPAEHGWLLRGWRPMPMEAVDRLLSWDFGLPMTGVPAAMRADWAAYRAGRGNRVTEAEIAHGGPDGYIDWLATSIATEGFHEALRVSPGVLMHGHHRYLAAKRLGLEWVPVEGV